MTPSEPIVVIRADGPDLVSEQHGAKAVGLQRLMRLGLPVPGAFVVPTAAVDHLLTDPAACATTLVDAAAALGSDRFAVRSGTSISLPGALDTHLGVTAPELLDAVLAVAESARGERARATADALGVDPPERTAVIVQRLIVADADSRSGSGAATSRHPVTSLPGATGSFWWERFGVAVMAGEVTPGELGAIAERMPDVHTRLIGDLAALEAELDAPVEVEFAIERGQLWYLQLRSFRTEPADHAGPVGERVAAGIAASAGIARGRLQIDIDDALDAADRGVPVVLARTTTSPADVSAMVRSIAVLTAHGARESHAAVVARSLGIPAVVGVVDLVIGDDSVTIGDLVIGVGDELIVDGTHGVIARPASGN